VTDKHQLYITIRKYVDSFEALHYGKKVDALFGQMVGSELALAILVKRISAFVKCVYQDYPEHEEIGRKCRIVLAKFDLLEKYVKSKAASRNKSLDKRGKNALKQLRRNLTRLKKEGDKHRLYLQTCPDECDRKHKTLLLLWPRPSAKRVRGR
jgi:hypothetical protein